MQCVTSQLQLHVTIHLYDITRYWYLIFTAMQCITSQLQLQLQLHGVRYTVPVNCDIYRNAMHHIRAAEVVAALQPGCEEVERE